jgi:O-antigen ligase
VQIGLNWTSYSFETWNAASGWLAQAVIFSIAYAGFQRERELKRLQRIAVWFGGAYSLLALLQWYSGRGMVLWIAETAYKSEGAGTFSNRGHYAAFIELLLPIALAAAIERKRSVVLPSVCAGLMFASVLACGSRAGTLLVCLEALIFLAVAGFRRNYVAAGVVAASLLVCTAIGGSTYVQKRFAGSDLFAARQEMLTSTLAMIEQRPVTGFGLGTWPTVYPAFAVFDPPGTYMNHAHNDWAEWAAEGGLPFAAVLAAFLLAAASGVRRNLWTIGILAVFAHGLIDFPLHKPAIVSAVFFLTGVSMGARKISAKSAAEESRSCEPKPLSLRPHLQSL